jgi:putative DNA methylase
MINAGWTFTGSWPIDTEMGSRLRAMDSAALASSIHLVCRPRENSDGSVREDDVGNWSDVLAELPQRIHAWLPGLAAEGVVGADAIFSCLGPALEIYSRYSRVEKASGEVVALKEYLEEVWAAVSREALGMIFESGDGSGLEEDARLTAMWLWTLSAGADNGDSINNSNEGETDEDKSPKSTLKGFILEYDAARKIAQGLGARMENLTTLVEVKGDKARLLPVSERTSYLFGQGVPTVAGKGRKKKKEEQTTLSGGVMSPAETEKGGPAGELSLPAPGSTVLDRLHQAMLLFSNGRSDALKRFIQEDIGQDQGLWSLAQSLSALYPAGSEERRWVEGVLTRKKSLGI